MSTVTHTNKHRTKPDYKPRDHYQDVTDRVIAALETGTAPWQRPWDPDKAGGPAMPINGATGRRYRGINTLMLGMSPLAFLSGDPRWASYKQASERGWQVRRGEKGTIVFFYKKLEIEDRKSPCDSGEQVKTIPLLRSFTVFHASQIDGIPPFAPPTLEAAPWRRPDAVETILRNSKAEIRIGGDRAFFSPSTDHIQLPPDTAFHTAEGWMITALHETAHWSGAQHRLNRDLTGRFGSENYAKEELRAQLASLLIGNELNLPADIPQHASYLASWIKILKNNKREIFHAAADAQKIADYLLAFHPDYAASADADAHREPAQDQTTTAEAA